MAERRHNEKHKIIAYAITVKKIDRFSKNFVRRCKIREDWGANV